MGLGECVQKAQRAGWVWVDAQEDTAARKLALGGAHACRAPAVSPGSLACEPGLWGQSVGEGVLQAPSPSTPPHHP